MAINDEKMNDQTVRKAGSSNKVWQIVVLAAFAIAAILMGYLTFITVRDVVKTWRLTSLPGVALQDGQTPVPNEEGVVTEPDVPLQAVGGPTPEPWDGAKRVNVLVMGLDFRDWSVGEGPPRTDTMMVFTLDPINRTAGMISVPRDLWVNIPGYNYGRINTAYQLGEAYKEIGGGPALAMKTVEELLGVPIDYYLQVDFQAFIDFIDEIGGVKVDVPEKIKIDPIKPGKSTNVITLKPGVQTLNGEYALAYARSRKTEGW